LETGVPQGKTGTVAGRTPVKADVQPGGTLLTERETTHVIPTG
jgi:hypothetical protein